MLLLKSLLLKKWKYLNGKMSQLVDIMLHIKRMNVQILERKQYFKKVLSDLGTPCYLREIHLH